MDDILWSLECIATLLPGTEAYAVAEGITLSPDRAERLRWQAVALRDCGKVARAERLLSFLHRLLPSHAGLLTELLLINTTFLPRADRVRAIADSLEGDAHIASAPALFIAFDAARAGDIARARHFWAHVDMSAERTGPFAAIYNEASLAMYLADDGLSLNEKLVRFLEQAAAEDTLHDAIRQAAFFNRFALQNPFGATANALLVAEPSFDNTALAHSLAFFSAIRQDGAARRIEARLMDDPKAWGLPHFAKWACLNAIRAGDRDRQQAVIARYLATAPEPGSLPPFSIAAAQDRELRARGEKSAAVSDITPADRGKSIFVGIFGQLRHYRHTLPLLVDYLHQDIMGAPSSPAIRLGLATWDKVGARPLALPESIDFFINLLPVELHDAVARSRAVDGFSLQRALPNITRRVMELSADVATRPVSVADVGALLPDGAMIRIDDEASFQCAMEEHLPAPLAEPAAHYVQGNMNQLRMWSRIAALGEMLEQAERDAGQRFDQVVLIRSDLIMRTGSLAALLAEANGNETTILSDYDAHAEYIEGIGDRYFVAGRAAIQPLFDCFAWLLEQARTLSPSLIRLNAHEGASAILFSHGRDALTRGSIDYELHRSRFALDDFEDAIAADAARNSPDMTQRELMTARDSE